MTFACIHIPNFMIQAAVRAEPKLCSGPVAIIEGKPPQLVVAANRAALKTGVELGMTALQAAQWNPVEIRQRSPAQEGVAHAALLDLGFSFSPRVEDTAADTVILDLAGLENLLGSPETAARKMTGQAAELGFAVHVAVAPNPEAAFHAARGWAGITVISPGSELQRLSCLPLEVLGPPEEILETFRCWGVRTFRDLAALPTSELCARLGQKSVQLQAQARGLSLRPLVPIAPKLQFEEVIELDHPADQLDSLVFAIGIILNRLCARLKARALALHELRLDMELDTRPAIEQCEAKPGAAQYQKRLRLPVPTQNSATLLKLLQIHLAVRSTSAPVAKIRIRAEAAKPRALQGGLFLPASPDPEKLEVTLARIAKIVGEENVGSPELVDTHRHDAFRMVRFNPFEDAAKTRCMAQRQVAFARNEKLTALWIFRPPLPVKVEVQNGIPARVFFNGMRGEVVSAAGPWRSSGDWWNDDSWQRDEWDVELKARRPLNHHRLEIDQTRTPISFALYRIYRDLQSGKWFVQGNYD